jgi:hypothetical protein
MYYYYSTESTEMRDHNEFDFERTTWPQHYSTFMQFEFSRHFNQNILGLGQFPDYLCLPICTLFCRGSSKTTELNTFSCGTV